MFVFLEVTAMVKLKSNTQSQALDKGRGIILLEESVDRFAITHDKQWFCCSPKCVSELFESQVDG